MSRITGTLVAGTATGALSFTALRQRVHDGQAGRHETDDSSSAPPPAPAPATAAGRAAAPPRRRRPGATPPQPRRPRPQAPAAGARRRAGAGRGRGTLRRPPPPAPPDGDAEAGDANRVGDGAVARSARRPQGRLVGRRRGCLEHEHDFRPRRRPTSRWARRIRTWPSAASTRSRGTTTASTSTTSRTRKSRSSRSAIYCPASQNDVSVYKNLLFMSSESGTSRSDCGFGGVPDPVSKDRVRGIRIFDITDMQGAEAGHERPDLPRLAHPHGGDAAGRQRRRVHLRVGHVGRALGRRAPGLPGRPVRRSEHGALPPRSDQGAAQGAGDGGDRQLAAHLQRAAGCAAQSRS